jgi:hypothetical protein
MNFTTDAVTICFYTLNCLGTVPDCFNAANCRGHPFVLTIQIGGGLPSVRWCVKGEQRLLDEL